MRNEGCRAVSGQAFRKGYQDRVPLVTEGQAVTVCHMQSRNCMVSQGSSHQQVIIMGKMLGFMRHQMCLSLQVGISFIILSPEIDSGRFSVVNFGPFGVTSKNYSGSIRILCVDSQASHFQVYCRGLCYILVHLQSSI